MGIFNRKKVKDSANESGYIAVDDPLLSALLSNEPVSRDMALTLPAVSKAVSFISSTFASVPIKLYREEFENGKRRVKEIFSDPRIVLLNDETGDTLNAYELKKAICTDYLLGKGGWVYIQRRRNIIDSLYYVRDNEISIFKNEDPIHKKYKLTIAGTSYKPYEFLRILRNTRDGFTSNSLITEIDKAITAAFSALCYELKITQTDGVKKGFIKSEKKLSKEAIDELKSAWNSMYSGNTENCIVLNNGLDFKEASSSAMEMQLTQIRNSLNKEISEAFEISENFNDSFRDSISPILDEFICSLNRDLLLESEKEAGYFFAADTRDIVKASMKERFEAYKLAIDGGFMGVNEARYEENWEEIEGQNVLRGSLGSVYFDIDKQTYFVPNIDGGTEGKEE